ncbi:hypothetical protein Ocin01_03576 [Orchesella cincta]|uniref:Uncharacterized protein n=1 Tax=Orchesella cincta TaxID=48709 RepID=A0A1D2NCW0_ORCCI|nr:hypothetical protein Ocin01_03576 [Orchesella cincta]
MELGSWSLKISFLLVLQFVGFARSDDACRDMVVGLMEVQMKNIVPCIKELNLNSGKERSDSYNCIMKCMLTKAGQLSPAGEITVLQSIISLLEMFPNQYIEKAFTEVQKCQEFAGQNMMDPNDKHCVKYAPLLKCGVEFMLNVCREG